MKLPKPYLSWSQISLWKKSPREYSKRYFRKERGFQTKEMTFGKRIGEALENFDLFDLTKGEQDIVSKIPRLKWYEYPLVLQMDGYYLMGFMDGFSDNKSIIHEYKTGKAMWTQDRVNKHGQLLMYAAMVFKNYAVLPTATVYWMETQNTEKKDIELTGELLDFDRIFTKEEIENFLNECDKVAKDIEFHYKMFLNK